MTANSTYPIGIMYFVFVFANVPFKGHFVQMYKLLSKHVKRIHVKVLYNKNDVKEIKALMGIKPAHNGKRVDYLLS